ncbi:rhomboid family intramembrane serine protease [Pseudoalteromonas sp. S16_S37]|uniref:rhomboid family intramembrane serine protease n=1 Tax=Pseudoalteromonas sp. S16_S37 TaxID=2720228 RepID=UPI001680B801|nr:rhomboid family intramembrane serine protease [Pseudoalteromonas sp. S16_S37]MBD1584257.1 rhomboid family intramembrane serine protease [Pseudoalteromonas sp. S16_S37]
MDIKNKILGRYLDSASNFKFILFMLLIMWLAHIFSALTGIRLSRFGLVPLSESHLLGIIIYPFLHSDWQHLIGNTLGLLISGYLASQLPCFKRATAVIFILTGALVWLFASYANHIGASGIVMGYFGFIMGSAVFRRNILSFLLAAALLAITHYFQINLFGTLFSFDASTSVSSHLFGFISGFIAAYVYRNKRSSVNKNVTI